MEWGALFGQTQTAFFVAMNRPNICLCQDSFFCNVPERVSHAWSSNWFDIFFGQLVSETYAHEVHWNSTWEEVWIRSITKLHAHKIPCHLAHLSWQGNNWAVLVETSKYWYNYRHAANASCRRNGWVPVAFLTKLARPTEVCISRE